MRLELAEFPVERVELGSELRYRSRVLEVSSNELAGIVLQDRRIREASLGLGMPGERVRITGVRDIVEPRVKVRGRGQVFPGILGPVSPVGDGLTHRLSGVAVVATAEYEGTIRSGLGVQRSAILDLWGPGAEASRFSSLISVVLILRLQAGLSDLEAHSAVQQAEFKVARRLAEATIGLEAEKLDVYELRIENPELPKVVHIQGCLTDSHHVHSGLSYYGMPIRDSLATLIHPNELFDGAIAVNTMRGIAYYPNTWDWQNHPVALGLYREHARRLNFLGVILERIRFETFHGKEAIAQNAAQMASMLGADAAVVTWIGSGNAFVDVMLTIKACEERGIKTVLMTYEYGGKDGIDSPLLYYVPEADAVVSTGSRDRWLELPEPDRVLGPYDQVTILSYPGAPVFPAKGPLSLDARDMVAGGVDNWGRESWTCRAY